MIFQKKNLALLIVFLTFHSFLDAQTSQSINGLSSNFIESVKSDEFGIIWIGTNEGLNALIDGRVYQYQSDLSDPASLLNTQINDIYVTDNNTVIALSNEGLNIFQRSNNSFKQIRTETRPISLYEDPYSNNIYIATENSGLIILNSELEINQSYKFDVFDPSTISTNNLTSLLDNNGIYFEQNKIWIATDRGLNIINREDSSVSRRLENTNGSLSSNVINGFSSININSSMIEPRTDYLLIGTDRGLNIYDRESSNLINQKQFVNTDVKNIIKINSKLFALLVNSKLTLLEYDSINQKFESKIIANEKDNSTFESIYQHENYLVAKGEDYLYIFDEDFRVIFEEKTEYPITEVNIKENFLWVGTQNGLTKYNLKGSLIKRLGDGTDYYSRNEYYEIQLKDNMFLVNDILNENTYEIEISEDFVNDKNKKIILKNNYLLALGNSTLHFYDLDFSFFALQFSYNFELELGSEVNNIGLNEESFYVTTNNATIEFESDLNNFSDFTFILPKNEYIYDELISPNVPPKFTDIERVDNSLWISSDIKTLSIHHIENLDDTLNFDFTDKGTNVLSTLNRIDNLYYDEENNTMYGGTSGRGLYSFDLELKTINRITKEDGLLSNNISDIHYQDGILFIQSGQGLNLIKDGKIRSITEEDGLFMTSFNKKSIHQIDSTNIVLSGTDGLYQFNYGDLYEIDASNEIKLFKVIGYDKFNNPYPIQFIDNKIQIDYQITSLLFDVYIGNHYKSDNNRFYYSINDDPYNANINGSQIVISSLPYYGSELSIYLVDANGNRSLNEIEIAITNKPPFWFSYQALLLYFIAIIGIYWLIQKRRVEKAKDEFEKERREKELNEARDLQQSLLPKLTPATNIFDISTYLQSANEMGGDYFDFIEFEDKLYSICGDATGHGVTSGIMVSVTKAGLNGVELNSPSTMLSKLNTIVKKVNFGRIRMSLSVVKLEENSIEISSAAMPPYFIYSAKNNKLNEVLIPNLPLGGLSRTQYESKKHNFEVGDILVMMSDGLPELPNESNELLDYEAIYNEIFDNIDKSAKQISNALLALGKKWRSHLDDLPDDITLVVIKKVA
jgi:hypothetical protein